jgi:hypothetical protein
MIDRDREVIQRFQAGEYSATQPPPEMGLLIPSKAPASDKETNSSSQPVYGRWRRRGNSKLCQRKYLPFLPELFAFGTNRFEIGIYIALGAGPVDLLDRTPTNDPDVVSRYSVQIAKGEDVTRHIRAHYTGERKKCLKEAGGFLAERHIFSCGPKKAVADNALFVILGCGASNRSLLTWEQMFFVSKRPNMATPRS